MDFHVYVHFDPAHSPADRGIEHQLRELILQGVRIMSGLTDLKAAVAALHDPIQAIVDYIQNTVPAQVKAAVDAALADNDAQAESIAQELIADGAILTGAIPTPSNPNPPPEAVQAAAAKAAALKG